MYSQATASQQQQQQNTLKVYQPRKILLFDARENVERLCVTFPVSNVRSYLNYVYEHE